MANNYQFVAGWKPSLPDIRDRMYAKRFSTFNLPRSIDLSRAPELNVVPWEPVWNQSILGSCGPHSGIADIVQAALVRQKKATIKMPSRLFLYYCTRLIMGTVNQDSGVDNRSLMKALVNYGYCDEDLHPYDINNFRAKPSAQAIEQAKGRKIKEYLSVPQSLEDMRACLANQDTFIYGFTVYESFQSSHTEGTGIVAMPQNEGVLGGHDVLIVGYDDDRKMFKFRNSYSNQWGENGYGWMPYDYATNAKLSGDFWSAQHDGTGPSVTPNPPPAPTEEYTITIRGVGKKPTVTVV